jgi:hypothetical protein
MSKANKPTEAKLDKAVLVLQDPRFNPELITERRPDLINGQEVGSRKWIHNHPDGLVNVTISRPNPAAKINYMKIGFNPANVSDEAVLDFLNESGIEVTSDGLYSATVSRFDVQREMQMAYGIGAYHPAFWASCKTGPQRIDFNGTASTRNKSHEVMLYDKATEQDQKRGRTNTYEPGTCRLESRHKTSQACQQIGINRYGELISVDLDMVYLWGVNLMLPNLNELTTESVNTFAEQQEIAKYIIMADYKHKDKLFAYTLIRSGVTQEELLRVINDLFPVPKRVINYRQIEAEAQEIEARLLPELNEKFGRMGYKDHWEMAKKMAKAEADKHREQDNIKAVQAARNARHRYKKRVLEFQAINRPNFDADVIQELKKFIQ